MSAHLLGMAFAADMGTCQRKLVLLKLVDHCHDDGSRIFPAVATVAAAAQCSVRSVQREMRRFVETGLLALVREGGKGAGNTNEYRLNLQALRMICDVGWEAWCAGEATTDDDGNKGDTVSPLPDEPRVTEKPIRVTAATHKGDTRSHTNPQEPLEPSKAREGARESGPVARPDRENPFGESAGNTEQAEGRFRKRFWPKWPDRVSSSKIQAHREFMALSDEDQIAAIAGIVPYHEWLKGQKQTYPRKAATYLKEAKWEELNGKPDTGGKYVPLFAKVWSPLWMASLIERVRTGDAWGATCDLNRIGQDSGGYLRFGAQRDAELRELSKDFEKVATHHERWQHWQAWLEREIVANPQREGRMSMFVRQGRLRPLSNIPVDPDNPFWLSVPSDAMAKAWGITFDLPSADTHPPPKPPVTKTPVTTHPTDDEASHAFDS